MTVETSIIIRTLNEGKYLENLLRGIHDQRYKDWEVLLVDSGSTDGTQQIAERYGATIHHISEEEFTYGRSLNLGCQKAHGRYLVFASGHVWPVNNGWLRNLLKPFEQPSVAMVYGRQRGTEVSRLSEQRDLQTGYGPTSRILVDEPIGNNGNAAVRRDLWLDQPFDESLLGLEDIDWARKVQQEGYWVYYAADAAVYHVHEETLKGVYRRHLREAIAYKRIFPAYRFTKRDLLKSLAYNTVRDILYALRHRRASRLAQVPGTRLAEFLGKYRGNHWHIKRSKEVARASELPREALSLVIDGPGRHELKTLPVPEVGPEEVLVRVAFAGVCDADLRLAGVIPEEDRPRAERYPVVPGREFVGVVAKPGPQVKRLKRGQKVVGRGAGGGNAHYVNVSERRLHRLPADMPLKSAVVLESVVTCLRAIDSVGGVVSRKTCVLGAGPLGNLCAQVLRHQGAHVDVVDEDERKLKLLQRYDLDTHARLGPDHQFDCYFVEEGRTAGRDLPKLDAQQTAVTIACAGGVPSEFAAQQLANGEDGFWAEAVRLVQVGALDLSDHTAVVEPLAAYERAWESQATGNRFKVILSIDAQLADL